jgi:hypothetical protein
LIVDGFFPIMRNVQVQGYVMVGLPVITFFVFVSNESYMIRWTMKRKEGDESEQLNLIYEE